MQLQVLLNVPMQLLDPNHPFLELPLMKSMLTLKNKAYFLF